MPFMKIKVRAVFLTISMSMFRSLMSFGHLLMSYKSIQSFAMEQFHSKCPFTTDVDVIPRNVHSLRLSFLQKGVTYSVTQLIYSIKHCPFHRN